MAIDELTFLSAPTAEELRPTPHEQHLMKDLLLWIENSAKSWRMVGIPDTEYQNFRKYS